MKLGVISVILCACMVPQGLMPTTSNTPWLCGQSLGIHLPMCLIPTQCTWHGSFGYSRGCAVLAEFLHNSSLQTFAYCHKPLRQAMKFCVCTIWTVVSLCAMALYLDAHTLVRTSGWKPCICVCTSVQLESPTVKLAPNGMGLVQGGSTKCAIQ